MGLSIPLRKPDQATKVGISHNNSIHKRLRCPYKGLSNSKVLVIRNNSHKCLDILLSRKWEHFLNKVTRNRDILSSRCKCLTSNLCGHK